MLYTTKFITSLTLIGLAASRPLETRDIQWGPCEDLAPTTNCTETCECATLAVPLDYGNESSSTIDLPLLRIPTENSQGSVLFNFGGPGYEARDTLATSALSLQSATGGTYDLVAFDPRGVANNIPFTCADDELDLYELGLGLDIELPLEGLWAQSQVLASKCLHRENATGSHIGTAAMARDLISVVDALEEDGLLRFWGVSYGTTLGATVAAMFPDRIDRIVLDGVQNVHEYYNDFVDFEEWTLSDTVFEGIWSTCLDTGPELCPLAEGYNDTATLVSDVYNLVDTIQANPVVISGTNYSFVIDYIVMRQLYSSALYGSDSWPVASAITLLLLTNSTDTGDLYDLFVASGVPLTPPAIITGSITSIATIGIHCADRVPRVSSLDELLPSIEKVQNMSRVMGDVTNPVTMACAVWPFHAAERYTGPWADIVLSNNPMLLLNNKWDGHTPLQSAYNSSAIFPGSRVLEVEAWGHGTRGVVSECLLNATVAYWVDGTVPAEGAKCKADLQPYETLESISA